jgi:two-component system heavy metal sensor histidine kinase CusS
MYSKNAPNNNTEAAPATRHWSIARRLTFLYASANAVMLLVAAAFLYWSLTRDVGQDDDAFLANKIQECRRLLRQHAAGSPLLAHEVQTEAAASQFIKYYVRVLNARGETEIETPGMPEILSAGKFPAPAEPGRVPARGTVTRSTGSVYLMMSARAEIDAEKTESRIVQAALDVSSDQELVAGYRWKLAVMVTLGVLFSCGAGMLVARRGLRPVKEITRATERITASQLHERIPMEGWPAELASLARSFDGMLDRLEQSFRRLSQYSADLAHELRTPINNLRGEAGVALSQPRTPNEYRQVLESSLEEYARLGRLIDNLLFLARADGQTTIAREECDARKAANVVTEYYSAVAEDKSVQLTCEGTGTVQADPIMLRQAISNLVANAVNHTPSGGRVNVAVEEENGAGAKITVTDTGCGISPEHIGKVCERLYRVDSARSQHVNGAGLGLAIVKSIMTLHGGTIKVESELQRGTTVTLLFPHDGEAEKLTKM